MIRFTFQYFKKMKRALIALNKDFKDTYPTLKECIEMIMFMSVWIAGICGIVYFFIWALEC